MLSSTVPPSCRMNHPCRAKQAAIRRCWPSSQAREPNLVPQLRRHVLTERKKTTYAKTTSSGTLKTTSEVVDSSQAPQSVILTSIFPTPDMPSSSKGGDTLSGVSPQVSTSHVSSAPGAASQSSIFRRASDTTSSTPSIHSSDLGQAFLSSIGNAEPTLSYTPSQSLAVAEPSKTSGRHRSLLRLLRHLKVQFLWDHFQLPALLVSTLLSLQAKLRVHSPCRAQWLLSLPFPPWRAACQTVRSRLH
jgi:hypothetical protein